MVLILRDETGPQFGLVGQDCDEAIGVAGDVTVGHGIATFIDDDAGADDLAGAPAALALDAQGKDTVPCLANGLNDRCNP